MEATERATLAADSSAGLLTTWTAPTPTAAHMLMLQSQQCKAIIDFLDSSRPTAALKECQKVLGLHKPNPTSDESLLGTDGRPKITLTPEKIAWQRPLAEALKALCLMKTGHREEALMTAHRMAQKGWGMADLDVLIPVTSVLDRYDQAHLSARLLDTGLKVHPTNETLGQRAFESCITAQDYQRAQQIALRIFKAHSKTEAPPPKGNKLAMAAAKIRAKKNKPDPAGEYFWWSMTGYHLMALHTPSAASLSLQLAERMILQHTSLDAFMEAEGAAEMEYFKGLPHEVEHLLLLLATLTKQKKLREAYKLLETPACRTLCGLAPTSDATTEESLVGNIDVKEVRWKVVETLGLWSEIKEEMRWRLKQGDRDWSVMRLLMQASIRTDSSDDTRKFLESLLPTNAITPITSAAAAITTAAEGDGLSGSKNKKKRQQQNKKKAAVSKDRAVFLARLQVAPSAILVEDYFERFGTKRCAFEDLHSTLLGLKHEEREAAGSTWLATAASASVPVETEAHLARYINAHKLRRTLRQVGTEEDEVAASKEYMHAYTRSLPVGKDLPKTEMQPGDELAFLAAEALVVAWWLSPERGALHYLVDAASILAQALERSPKGYILRLLLIRVLLKLGSWSLALDHFHELGIRSVQQDSMGHWIFERASTFASAASAVNYEVPEAMKMLDGVYKENDEETQRFIYRSFVFGNYSKAEELADFHRCLRNSLFQRQMELEAILCDRDDAEMRARALLTLCDDLRDQRDFTLLPSYTPLGVPALGELVGTGPRPTTQTLVCIASAVAGIEAAEEAPLSAAEKVFCGGTAEEAMELMASAATPFDLMHATEYVLRRLEPHDGEQLRATLRTRAEHFRTALQKTEAKLAIDVIKRLDEWMKARCADEM